MLNKKYILFRKNSILYKYKGENNMSKKVVKPKNKVDIRWDVVVTDF